MSKYSGLGWLLTVNVDGGSTTSTIGQIIEALENSASADDIEATDISQTVKAFIKGQVDPGSFSFSVLWDGNDATSQLLASLMTANVGGGPLPSWTLTSPDPHDEGDVDITFDGYLKTFGFSTGGPQGTTVLNLEIKVSGSFGHPTN